MMARRPRWARRGRRTVEHLDKLTKGADKPKASGDKPAGKGK